MAGRVDKLRHSPEKIAEKLKIKSKYPKKYNFWTFPQ